MQSGPGLLMACNITWPFSVVFSSCFDDLLDHTEADVRYQYTPFGPADQKHLHVGAFVLLVSNRCVSTSSVSTDISVFVTIYGFLVA